MTALAFYGDEWLLVSGSDGLLALDGRNPELRGGLHLLEDGGWFSVVNRTFSTFVDGDEGALDAVAAFPNGSPGLYWEGFGGRRAFPTCFAGSCRRTSDAAGARDGLVCQLES